MATKWIVATMTALFSMLTGGCLIYDRTDTFYLEPDGAVVWSVIEKDVRSDGSSAEERRDEEATYLSSVRAQNHDLARGLRLLSPMDLQTRMLRSTLPYTVVTEARFTGIDVVGQRLIARLGLVGSSMLESSAEGTEWTFRVRQTPDANGAPSDGSEIELLAGGLDHLQVVLTRGGSWQREVSS